ncbi:MAG: amino acid permease, partial [Bacillota bacterium]
MQKKLNTLTLSGLMIGPILGSGIVLLPPMAISILGGQAIYAWTIIMVLGIVFAYVFAKMSLLISSNEGMSTVIGQSLGQSFRELASNYLTAAVCFGPVAVMLTASEFLSNILKNLNLNKTILAFIVLILCVTVILRGITTVGKLTLLFSSLTAVLLVAGSIYSLLTQAEIFYPTGVPEPGKLGYTLLLLFWAIIGWEVIGNYVEEVEKPELTIMRAMKISVGAIIIVYLLSAFAMQNRIQL